MGLKVPHLNFIPFHFITHTQTSSLGNSPLNKMQEAVNVALNMISGFWSCFYTTNNIKPLHSRADPKISALQDL